MPELDLFYKGFGFHEGIQVKGWTCIGLGGTHETKVRYREYSYTLIMEWEGTGNGKELLNEIRKMTSGTRVINSRYGNPYECGFGQPELVNEVSGRITIRSYGWARRI